MCSWLVLVNNPTPGASSLSILVIATMTGDEVQVRAPAVHQGPFRGAVVRYVQWLGTNGR